MLSANSKEIIRATLPAVGAAIDEITPLFYRKMFAAHPELERDLFNRGNQKQGEQQKALAGAIAGVASLQLDPDPRGRGEAVVANRAQACLAGNHRRAIPRSCTSTSSRRSSRCSVTR